MARIDIPAGDGGDAVMVWTLRPDMGAMVERMVSTVYGKSILPAEEREVARFRVAQLNACDACATFRAPSVVEAGVIEELYEHVEDFSSYAGYTDRQRLAIEYAERFATDHQAIDDDMFARLRAAFTDEEILDLTMCVSVYVGLGRALEVLGIDQPAPMEI
jgi:AhpD family alkylhydroperoxidase